MQLFRFNAASAKQAVREGIGGLAVSAAPHNSVGQPPQVFDKHNTQRNGQRPEFADGQRLHVLIGQNESPQKIGVEAAVGMRDKRPGNA